MFLAVTFLSRTLGHTDRVRVVYDQWNWQHACFQKKGLILKMTGTFCTS